MLQLFLDIRLKLLDLPANTHFLSMSTDPQAQPRDQSYEAFAVMTSDHKERLLRMNDPQVHVRGQDYIEVPIIDKTRKPSEQNRNPVSHDRQRGPIGNPVSEFAQKPTLDDQLPGILFPLCPLTGPNAPVRLTPASEPIRIPPDFLPKLVECVNLRHLRLQSTQPPLVSSPHFSNEDSLKRDS